MLFQIQWDTERKIYNPVLILMLVYLLSMLVMFIFQDKIIELVKQKEKTRKMINQTLRDLPFGLMIVERPKDELPGPSSLIISKTNLAFERLFNITSRELKNQKAKDLFMKVFRGKFDWKKHYTGTLPGKASFYLEHLDRHFEVSTFQINDNEMVSLFYDVSKLQNQLIDLTESKEKYKVLLEAIPDLFFIIDSDGYYADFVFKVTDSIQVKPEDIIGSSIFEVGFSERMATRIFQSIKQCIANDTIETIEYAIDANEETAFFEMRIARLNDHSVISLARDITKRKKAEKDLEEAKNRAEESDHLKTAFINNVSHELRTPMNAILGFSKMLGSNEYSKDEKDYFVEIIDFSGQKLDTLINDMICLAQIESHTLVAKKTACRLNELMEELFLKFKPVAEQKNQLKFIQQKDSRNRNIFIQSDPTLLKSTMEKLIDNAIKFTSEGEVEFGFCFPKPNLIEFYVKDTGIGISEMDHERIFDRFHQIENGSNRMYEGAGLGLSLAKSYIHLLGGKIEIQSELGKGTRFYFNFPYEESNSPLRIVR
jgi:PAS domain S-box-containing protein